MAELNLGRVVGQDGERGEPGKSAYAYAQEAGFVGTEQEFSSNLAGINEKANKTPDAVEGNIAILDAEGNPTDSGKNLDEVGGKVPIVSSPPSDDKITFWLNTETPVEDIPAIDPPGAAEKALEDAKKYTNEYAPAKPQAVQGNLLIAGENGKLEDSGIAREQVSALFQSEPLIFLNGWEDNGGSKIAFTENLITLYIRARGTQLEFNTVIARSPQIPIKQVVFTGIVSSLDSLEKSPLILVLELNGNIRVGASGRPNEASDLWVSSTAIQ